MTILKENFNYRLGLIKQLKHDMKNNFKSEAQQLYCDYHSIKNQTQNQPTLSDMHTVYSMPNNSHDLRAEKKIRTIPLAPLLFAIFK